MSHRRLGALVIALLVAGSLLLWAWRWEHRPPELRFERFGLLDGKHCAVFSLENAGHAGFEIRTGDAAPQVFVKVQREGGWDAEPAPTRWLRRPRVNDFGFWKNSPALLHPGNSARFTIPVPEGDAAAGRPFKTGLRVFRLPSEPLQTVQQFAPWLVPASALNPEEVMTWSEVVLP